MMAVISSGLTPTVRSFLSSRRQTVARRILAFSTADEPPGQRFRTVDSAEADERPAKPRPRSAIAMAYFDHKIELEQRIQEEGGMPDREAAFEILANHRIREAMKDGGFDHLPGKGKPLPSQEANFDMSLKILKNANMVPEWVEVGKQVRKEIGQLRSRTRAALVEANAPVGIDSAKERAEALAIVRDSDCWKAMRFEEELLRLIQAMNEKISAHNSAAPSSVVHIMPMRLDSELRLAMMDLSETRPG